METPGLLPAVPEVLIRLLHRATISEKGVTPLLDAPVTAWSTSSARLRIASLAVAWVPSGEKGCTGKGWGWFGRSPAVGSLLPASTRQLEPAEDHRVKREGGKGWSEILEARFAWRGMPNSMPTT
jgi:hypothetical protein